VKLFPYPRFGTAVFFLILTTIPVFSQDILSGVFWCEYEPIVAGTEYPQTDEEAARLVLEEARYIFSGMIYGFSFHYTPSDRARGVDELFELDLIHSIPWGDENLRIIGGSVDREYYRAGIRYELEDFQQRRLDYWESNMFPMVSGSGSGDLFVGREGKHEAIRQAVKNAVRNYLRPRYFNKPMEITGEAVPVEVPYVVIDAGGYHAGVLIKLRIREVLPYPVY